MNELVNGRTLTDVKTDNKSVAKNKGGRPVKYQSASTLQRAINRYFEECDNAKSVYTVSGLALSLGTDRKTITNYEKREEFFPIIADAKTRIEQQLESMLPRQKGQVTGIMFNLKNNFGWKEKSETEVKNTHMHLHKLTKEAYNKADTIVHEHTEARTGAKGTKDDPS